MANDKTTLIMPGNKKMLVSRLLKQVALAAIAVCLTSLVILAVLAGNGLLVGRGSSMAYAINIWLAFIKRSDILVTMALTSMVTVLFVYWQRDRERR
jgi:hypothetical protein